MTIQNVQRFSRSPSLISPLHAQEIAALANAPERTAERTDLQTQQLVATFGYENEKGKPFPFAAGIAIIPVYGALLHRDRWCDSYATGYDYIDSRFSAALGDEDVKGIMFDVNSYGGHVAGNFELCEKIYAARGVKPMAAMVDSRSLSGGYSLSSAVGRIIATPSSDIGSIGVVMMHMSYEKMLENYGVEVTFIFAGKHKVDGNPFQELPKDVQKALQASVEKSYEKFVALVARNRGIEAEAVRNTEAQVYDAEDAKALGLIDDVMVSSDAFAAFLTEVSTASTQTKEVKKMTTQNNGQQVEGAGGEGGAPTPDNSATIRAEAAAAAQARVKEILASDEAKERPTLANHLALETNIAAADARALLAKAAPETKADAAADPLAAAMAGTGGGPDVGAGGGGEEEAPAMTRGARLLKNAAAHFGVRAN